MRIKQHHLPHLITNLKLYFDQWENSLQNNANPQFSDDVEKAVGDAEAALEGGDEEEDAGGEEEVGEDELDLDI